MEGGHVQSLCSEKLLLSGRSGVIDRFKVHHLFISGDDPFNIPTSSLVNGIEWPQM